MIRKLDLSIKQQLLDIMIVRRRRGDRTPVLPDGLVLLADHNLLTYKSLHEPLDGWALKELVGHWVNDRKQVSPALDRLLPEESFRLFVVATRFPEKLAGKVPLHPQDVEVHDVAWGTDTVRVLMLNWLQRLAARVSSPARSSMRRSRVNRERRRGATDCCV